MAASYPSSIWDGSYLTDPALFNRWNSDQAVGAHITKALALDLTRLSEEIIAIQNHLTSKIEDIRIPANALRLSGTKPPTWTAYKSGRVLAFSDQSIEGNEEIVYFTTQIPRARIADSNITLYVHWVGQDNTAGDVRWKFTHSWANIDGIFPSATTLTVDATNGATDEHNLATFSSITGTGFTGSSVIICSLRRNSSHVNDTFTGKNAYLLGVNFRMSVSGIGDDPD